MNSPRRTICSLCLAACLPAWAAMDPPTAPASAPQAEERSATAADANVPDLLRHVLPYDPLEEHIRFSVATGGEGKELSESAFNENRTRHHPFVRKFDRWEVLLQFDRNGNGTISWTEANRYRLALGKAVLAAYDTDRDGRLTGDERAAANKALAEGNLPSLRPEKNAPTQTDSEEGTPAANPAGSQEQGTPRPSGPGSSARPAPTPAPAPASEPASQPAQE